MSLADGIAWEKEFGHETHSDERCAACGAPMRVVRRYPHVLETIHHECNYIAIPEEFTTRRNLYKSRYRVERTDEFVHFTREFWNGSRWERSPFSDGITVPKCIAPGIIAALRPAE